MWLPLVEVLISGSSASTALQDGDLLGLLGLTGDRYEVEIPDAGLRKMTHNDTWQERKSCPKSARRD